jgi:hypothetical protein
VRYDHFFHYILAACTMDDSLTPRCHRNVTRTDDHYPINMLRNVAQQHVSTTWLMALDIDVIPSSCMATHVAVCQHP